MKTKNIPYLILCSLVLSLFSCEKDTEARYFAPEMSTGNAIEIYRTGATLQGSIDLSETSGAQSYGILLSEVKSMAEYTEFPITDGNTDYEVELRNLSPGTTYYYCTYANSGYTLVKGEVKSFETTSNNAPVFNQVVVDSIGIDRIYLSTEILDEGGSELMVSGFCWREGNSGVATYIDNIVNVEEVINDQMSVVIAGLVPSQDYVVSAYSVNLDGMGFSHSLVLQTAHGEIPVLGKLSAQDSTFRSITVSGSVEEEGTFEVTRIGICWSSDTKLPVLPEKDSGVAAKVDFIDLTDQLDKDAFTTTIAGLDLGTTYYIRSYASNKEGTAYSKPLIFITPEERAPALEEVSEMSSGQQSVSFESQITDDGTSNVLEAGFCWSKDNPVPTTEDQIIDLTDQLTDGNRKFSTSLEGLELGTTYYVRAYATNEEGTDYSEVFIFRTAEPTPPMLSVITQKDSLYTSVTVESSLTDIGTSKVKKAGFCWSKDNQEPTESDASIDLTQQLADGGLVFSTTLKDLELGTTYYIRAYATNEEGTSYSEVSTYRTSDPKVPTLIAITQKGASYTSVTVESGLADAGTSEVQKVGFYWSKDNKEPDESDASIDLSKQLAEGTVFSATLSDLELSSTYYIRAYATNGEGTSYSEVFTYQTADPQKPIVSGITQTTSTNTSVTFQLTITDSGTAKVEKAGFYWSKDNQTPDESDTAIDLTQQLTDSNSTLSTTLKGLALGTTYYIRGYAVSEVGTTYSEVFVYKTVDPKAPVLSAIKQTASTNTSVAVSATITDSGTSDIQKAGFYWSKTNSNPGASDASIDLTKQLSSSNSTLSTNLEGLDLGSTYYVRAYATNSEGTSYSAVFTYQTADPKVPVLSVVSQTAFTNTSVSVSSTVTDPGTSDVKQAGFCWSKDNQEPTSSDASIDLTKQLTSSNSTLSTTLEDLELGTTYYVRAYATNSEGTSYSAVFTYQTADPKVPVLSVVSQTAFTNTSVSVSSTVTDPGTSDVKQAGFCWSKDNQEPTSSDASIDLTKQLTSSNSTLSTTLEDLELGATYYVRAYATNNEGTSYSEVFTYQTAEPKAPALSSISQTASSKNSVSIGVDLTDRGSSEVTQAGFYWSSTNSVPTASDTTVDLTHLLTGNNNTLTTTLSGLAYGTTYYIRAFAKNGEGITYSDVFTFTTVNPEPPTLSAITQTASTTLTVSLEAVIAAAGTSSVKKAGFCWSDTNQRPTSSDTSVDLSSQLSGSNTKINTTLSNLKSNTTYYIRAYATNSEGTTYSMVHTFKTGSADVGSNDNGINTLPETNWE